MELAKDAIERVNQLQNLKKLTKYHHTGFDFAGDKNQNKLVTDNVGKLIEDTNKNFLQQLSNHLSLFGMKVDRIAPKVVKGRPSTAGLELLKFSFM